MSRSITGKLIDICNAIIGHIKGSLSLVTILASALFGAISGLRRGHRLRHRAASPSPP